ncbi:hypothetical protein AMS59_06170 [Lysinibacillus sp. FJAT-14745]|nr:hypothetical protein AMS59_06170 [Lysinibacillus sp. FJAT-14745]
MGISNRGTKAKSITSCDNAFVTNILLPRDPAAKRMFSVRKRSANVAAATKAAHRTPPGSSALRESEASAANVLSVRKRSVSNKAPSRNGNQPHVMVMNSFNVNFVKYLSERDYSLNLSGRNLVTF